MIFFFFRGLWTDQWAMKFCGVVAGRRPSLQHYGLRPTGFFSVTLQWATNRLNFGPPNYQHPDSLHPRYMKCNPVFSKKKKNYQHPTCLSVLVGLHLHDGFCSCSGRLARGAAAPGRRHGTRRRQAPAAAAGAQPLPRSTPRGPCRLPHSFAAACAVRSTPCLGCLRGRASLAAFVYRGRSPRAVGRRITRPGPVLLVVTRGDKDQDLFHARSKRGEYVSIRNIFVPQNLNPKLYARDLQLRWIRFPRSRHERSRRGHVKFCCCCCHSRIAERSALFGVSME